MAKKLPTPPPMPDFGPKKLPAFNPATPVIAGQLLIKPICPYCKSKRVRVRATAPGRNIRYYECLDCVATDSGQPTTFKVQEKSRGQG